MDIADRIKSLRIDKISAKDAGELAELTQLYRILYGKALKANCGNCRIRAYSEITSFNLSNLNKMAKQFKLGGAVLYFNGDHFTDENLTDDVAVAALKVNPAAIDQFSEYPKDDKGNLILPEEKEESKPAKKKNDAAAE